MPTPRRPIVPVPKPPAPLPLPLEPDGITLTRTHPTIRKRTKEIVDFGRALRQRDVEQRVELGRMLKEVHRQLAHGEWLVWIKKDLPFDARLVQRAIQLHDWAEENPRLFHDHRFLGTTKLLVIASQPPGVQQTIFGRKLHTIPGTRVRVTLEKITRDELMAVVFALRPGRALSPGDKATKTFQKSLNALDRATDAIEAHAKVIDRQDAEIWHARLLEAAARIASAFSLDGS